MNPTENVGEPLTILLKAFPVVGIACRYERDAKVTARLWKEKRGGGMIYGVCRQSMGLWGNTPNRIYLDLVAGLHERVCGCKKPRTGCEIYTPRVLVAPCRGTGSGSTSARYVVPLRFIPTLFCGYRHQYPEWFDLVAGAVRAAIEYRIQFSVLSKPLLEAELAGLNETIALDGSTVDPVDIPRAKRGRRDDDQCGAGFRGAATAIATTEPLGGAKV
jgi:hypothetical protein